MKYNCLLAFGLLLTILSCNSRQKDTIQDFVREPAFDLIDTSEYVSTLIFKEKFDTIPVNFGYTIFNKLIKPIPVETSRFKQIWDWEVDSIRHVLARRKDIRLDPHNNLSSETYFLIIEFLTPDSLPIASTIYLDLENETMGTYMFSLDSLKYVMHNDDITKVIGLKDKIKMH